MRDKTEREESLKLLREENLTLKTQMNCKNLFVQAALESFVMKTFKDRLFGAYLILRGRAALVILDEEKEAR